MVDVSAIPAIGKPNAGKGKEKAVAVASDEEKPAPSKKDKGKGKAPAVDVKSSAARPNKVSKMSYMVYRIGTNRHPRWLRRRRRRRLRLRRRCQRLRRHLPR